MAIIETIINREAGGKSEGARLQRLRWALLTLKAIEKSDNPHIYSAVEDKEDVFVKDAMKRYRTGRGNRGNV